MEGWEEGRRGGGEEGREGVLNRKHNFTWRCCLMARVRSDWSRSVARATSDRSLVVSSFSLASKSSQCFELVALDSSLCAETRENFNTASGNVSDILFDGGECRKMEECRKMKSLEIKAFNQLIFVIVYVYPQE